VGLGLIAYSRRSASLDQNAPATPEPLEASGQTSALKHIQESGLLGVVVATQSVDLAPKLTGRLETVQARMGQSVNANAVIATLDAASIRHDLNIGEQKLKVARAEQAKAKTELTQAKDEFDALTPLRNSGHISARELAGAQYKLDAAAAAYEGAQAHVAELEANVQQLKQTLADTQIRAPFAGVISERYADPGAMVSPSVPVVRLVSAGDLRVRFAVPEQSAGALALGMTVQVQVSTVNVPFRGVVENISPEVDIASGHVYADAKLDAEGIAALNKPIPSGTEARVTIIAPVHTGQH
jgi:RND family efflux transporter MFP subunit